MIDVNSASEDRTRPASVKVFAPFVSLASIKTLLELHQIIVNYVQQEHFSREVGIKSLVTVLCAQEANIRVLLGRTQRQTVLYAVLDHFRQELGCPQHSIAQHAVSGTIRAFLVR